ncbi:nuclear transport factor 2 family protein [Gordonia sp. OPL2]|uniref:nuclear transport factor 2 family protein n=1 Tax=Gordonia sp. OPL2 TaxID=2486274 RepID=UPI001655CB3F|nr:nuclear transport factor 2 family protein [Gordonia sp. OPL2]ROZ85477.1 nuclear transport factor 2 family protein [Gordonia sp. OPL2]
MSETPAPVQRLLDAVNAGDTSAFLAAFTDDGYVDDWGRVFTGGDAIKGWSDSELIGKQATLAPTTVTADGDSVTVIATVGGNGFNGPSTFTFGIREDRVSGMTIRE